MGARSTRVPDRERLRLARATRALAQAERTDFHRAGVVVLGTVSLRLELLERIARLLEDPRRDISPAAAASVARLVGETPPVRDYGPSAHARNDRIATVLEELGGDL